jgi:hypothetical protein
MHFLESGKYRVPYVKLLHIKIWPDYQSKKGMTNTLEKRHI